MTITLSHPAAERAARIRSKRLPIAVITLGMVVLLGIVGSAYLRANRERGRLTDERAAASAAVADTEAEIVDLQSRREAMLATGAERDAAFSAVRVNADGVRVSGSAFVDAVATGGSGEIVAAMESLRGALATYQGSLDALLAWAAANGVTIGDLEALSELPEIVPSSTRSRSTLSSVPSSRATRTYRSSAPSNTAPVVAETPAPVAEVDDPGPVEGEPGPADDGDDSADTGALPD